MNGVRVLLLAYPPDYRARRGEEIMGTLAEVTPPGHRWPPARELVSVITSGLRTRREANLRADSSLRLIAVLGITLYLISLITAELFDYLFHARSVASVVDPVGWQLLLPAAAITATLVLAWSGRARLTAVAALLSGVAVGYIMINNSTRIYAFGPATPDGIAASLGIPLLALAALAWLTPGTNRPPRSWLWLPGLTLGVTAIESFYRLLPFNWGLRVISWLGGWVPLFWPDTSQHFVEILVVLCVCALLTDPRLLAGLALGLALEGTDLNLTSSWHPWFQLVGAAAPLAAAIVLTWLLSRRKRTIPPAAS